MSTGFAATCGLLAVSAALLAGGAEGGSIKPNDNFANAEVLTAPEALSTHNRANATSEPGEPAHAGVTANQSLWYRFTAPSNGTVSFDTCATLKDSHIAVYTGNALASLTGVTSDNGGCTAPRRIPRLISEIGSKVSFPVSAGIAYSIAVDTQTISQSGDVTAHLVFTPAVVPDTKAPETTIIKGPKKKVKRRKATFTFSANEAGARFECSLNRAPFAACSSPAKVKGKRGKNRFEIKAIDAAGNADATPAAYSWKVKKKKRR